MANQALWYWDKDVPVDRTHQGKDNLPFKPAMMSIQMTFMYYSFLNRVFKRDKIE